MLFGQGHKGQTQSPCQNGAKPPEERQQNAEEAHRARGAPRGALPEKTGIWRRFAELRKYNRAVTRGTTKPDIQPGRSSSGTQGI